MDRRQSTSRMFDLSCTHIARWLRSTTSLHRPKLDTHSYKFFSTDVTTNTTNVTHQAKNTMQYIIYSLLCLLPLMASARPLPLRCPQNDDHSSSGGLANGLLSDGVNVKLIDVQPPDFSDFFGGVFGNGACKLTVVFQIPAGVQVAFFKSTNGC